MSTGTLPTTPRLTQRYDRIWDSIANASDSGLVYTRIRWSKSKSGYITMKKDMHDRYLSWCKQPQSSGFFKDFAAIDGLTAFVLDPEGKVTLTANITPMEHK